MSTLIDTSNFIENRLAYNLGQPITKPITNIVAANGKFQIRNNRLMQITTKDETIMKDLPELSESFHMNIRKIPFHVFEIMGSFFKKVYEKDRTESSLMVFYNEKNDTFDIFPPLQENSSAASKYKREEDPAFVKKEAESLLVMVAHSHPWAATSAPSPSGIDNNDEKEALLYLIMSNVSEIPTFTLSTCPNGQRRMLNFKDVFDYPKDRFDREEMLEEVLANIPEPIIRSIFARGATDEEIEELFYKDLDPVRIVQKAYTHCVEKIPEEWMSRCTKNYASAAYTGVGKYNTSKYTQSKYDYKLGRYVYSEYDENYGTNYDAYQGYGSYGTYQTANNQISKEIENELEDRIITQSKSKTSVKKEEVIDEDSLLDDIVGDIYEDYKNAIAAKVIDAAPTATVTNIIKKKETETAKKGK